MSDVVSKWGQSVAQRGFAQIPNYLLLLNQFLGEEHRLSPIELLLLIQLAGSWWKKDSLPFPSINTLAMRCGVSGRQVQRSLLKLEKLGLIRRLNRRSGGLMASNAYDLEQLTSFLGDVAKAFPNKFPRQVDLAVRDGASGQLRLSEDQFSPAQSNAISKKIF